MREAWSMENYESLKKYKVSEKNIGKGREYVGHNYASPQEARKTKIRRP